MTAAPPRAGRREWIGLGVIALPCLLYAMDLTVLELAVPQLSMDLRPSSAQLLWILDIYGFLVAGSLITMGTLGDRIGRRRMLLIGAATFGVGSILAAFSRSAEMLIATRALLGVAGATLAPSTLSLIRNMFLDEQQRRTAIGVWITSYSVGGAIGPLIGGVLLEHFWWGSVFLIGLPVMVLLLVVGPVLLPEYRDPDAGRLDLISAVMSLASVLLVVYGLKKTAENGPGWLPVLCVLAGVAIGYAFVYRQKKLQDPLIDIALFRLPAFSAALASYMMATFVAFASYFFIAQYLQLVLGLSPLRAGLWTLPFMLGFVAGSNVTPILARRIRPAFLIAGGFVVAAVGFLILVLVDRSSPLITVVIASTIFSLGLSPAFTLSNDVILAVAPPRKAGAAAAISETSSELGGALGIAMIGSLGTAIYRRAMTGGVPEAARATLGGALATAKSLPAPLGAELLANARDAFTHGLQVSAIVCAILAVATAVITLAIVRKSQIAMRH